MTVGASTSATTGPTCGNRVRTESAAYQRTLPTAPYNFDGQRSGIEELVQHVAARDAGREPPAPLVSPGSAGRQTLEIILGILRSHHEGNAKITFPLAGDS